jgi:hypothetical protein
MGLSNGIEFPADVLGRLLDPAQVALQTFPNRGHGAHYEDSRDPMQGVSLGDSYLKEGLR